MPTKIERHREPEKRLAAGPFKHKTKKWNTRECSDRRGQTHSEYLSCRVPGPSFKKGDDERGQATDNPVIDYIKDQQLGKREDTSGSLTTGPAGPRIELVLLS